MFGVTTWAVTAYDGGETAGGRPERRFQWSGSFESAQKSVWASQSFRWKGNRRLPTSFRLHCTKEKNSFNRNFRLLGAWTTASITRKKFNFRRGIKSNQRWGKCVCVCAWMYKANAILIDLMFVFWWRCSCSKSARVQFNYPIKVMVQSPVTARWVCGVCIFKLRSNFDFIFWFDSADLWTKCQWRQFRLDRLRSQNAWIANNHWETGKRMPARYRNGKI